MDSVEHENKDTKRPFLKRIYLSIGSVTGGRDKWITVFLQVDYGADVLLHCLLGFHLQRLTGWPYCGALVT